MSNSIRERILERIRKASLTRLIATVLLGIVFLAVSALVVESMISSGYGDWWALTLVVALLWLVYVGLMKFLIWNDSLGDIAREL